MTESQSEKFLGKHTPNISVGIHVGSSLVKVKDTHLMNNDQPMAENLCRRLGKCIIYILCNVSSHWLSVMPSLIGQSQLCIWVISTRLFSNSFFLRVICRGQLCIATLCKRTVPKDKIFEIQ